jgi:hypothetical protein
MIPNLRLDLSSWYSGKIEQNWRTTGFAYFKSLKALSGLMTKNRWFCWMIISIKELHSTGSYTHPYFHHSLLTCCFVFFFGFQISWILFSSAFISCRVELPIADHYSDLPWSWHVTYRKFKTLEKTHFVSNVIMFQETLEYVKPINFCYI